MEEHGFSASSPGSDKATITVLSPTPGQVFSPGDIVSVRLAPKGGATIQSAVIVAGGEHGCLLMSVIETPPYVVDFPIPQNTIGNINIGGMAVDTINNISLIDLTITVNTNAIVQAIALGPTAGEGKIVQLTSIGETRAFLINCLYSDGVTRDVTNYHTQYSSSNPSVATVSNSGLVTAVGKGYSLITAFNGGKEDTTPVIVELEPPWFASIEPAGASAGQTITLQISGRNFGGASNLQLLTWSGQPASNIVVSDLTVLDPYRLTATVSIAKNCAAEDLMVVMTTVGGTSDTIYPNEHAAFVVTPSVNTLLLRPGDSNYGLYWIEGVLLLTESAPREGLTITLSSSDPSVSVWENNTIYYGRLLMWFEATASLVQTPTAVTITATVNGLDGGAPCSATYLLEPQHFEPHS